MHPRKVLVLFFLLLFSVTAFSQQRSGAYTTAFRTPIMYNSYMGERICLNGGVLFTFANHIQIETGLTSEFYLDSYTMIDEKYTNGDFERSHYDVYHYGFGPEFFSKFFLINIENETYFNFYTGSMFRFNYMIERSEFLYTNANYVMTEFGTGEVKNFVKPIFNFGLVGGITLGRYHTWDFYCGYQHTIDMSSKDNLYFYQPWNFPVIAGLRLGIRN